MKPSAAPLSIEKDSIIDLKRNYEVHRILVGIHL